MQDRKSDSYSIDISLQELNYSSLLLDNFNLNTVGDSAYFVYPNLIDLASEKINISYKLENQNNSQFDIPSNLVKTETIKVSNFLDTLDNLHKVSYAADNKNLKNIQTKEINAINKELKNKDWPLLLASTDSLQTASTQDFVKDLLKEETYSEAIEKLKKRADEENLNWQQEFSQTVDVWLDKQAARWIDYFNSGVQDALNGVAKYQKATKSYLGNRNLFASDAAASILNTTSAGARTISSAMRSSTKDLSMYFNSYIRPLNDSILSKSYLDNIKKGRIWEPVYPYNMTFINPSFDTKEGNIAYGPSFLPIKTTSNTLTLTASFIRKKFNLQVVNIDTSKTYAPFIFRGYDINNKAKLNADSNNEAFNNLYQIITNLDAQLQYYLAYFTRIDNEGNEKILKLYIKTPLNNAIQANEDTTNIAAATSLDNQYYYFFYTNNFNFKAVKKSTSDLKYGAYSTPVSLMKPDGKNEVTFSAAADLELSFWDFILKNGLGFNTNLGIPSNMTKEASSSSINLNFLLIEQSEKNTLDTTRFNQFILEDVHFSSIDRLDYKHDPGQMKLKINGVYNKLIWYHNRKMQDIPF